MIYDMLWVHLVHFTTSRFLRCRMQRSFASLVVHFNFFTLSCCDSTLYFQCHVLRIQTIAAARTRRIPFNIRLRPLLRLLNVPEHVKHAPIGLTQNLLFQHILHGPLKFLDHLRPAEGAYSSRDLVVDGSNVALPKRLKKRIANLG
jgi:hypothetical protein